jgi:DNA-directed RNA polymerase subunit RPC12/RpoP
MDSQVRILIKCPQCAGDIDFLEEAQVVRCSFCGSLLLVAGREGVLRYVLPTRIREPQAAKAQAMEHLRGLGKRPPRSVEAFLFHAPFWRMQGTVYRWIFGLKPMKVEPVGGTPPPRERVKVLLTRVLDHTIGGYADLELGLSTLGVRAQALRLQPFSREHQEKGTSFFLPLEVSLKEVQTQAECFSEVFFESEDLVPEVILHRLVGRCFSVIYFPIWKVDCQHEGGQEALLIDALAGKVIQATSDGSPIQKKLTGGETLIPFKFSEIRFLPFRCPNCGWDFPFRPLSVLHFCPTCRRLWREKGGSLKEAGYWAILPPPGRSLNGLLWVPFWRCRTVLESAGERLETMADLYRLAPPPRVVNWEQEARRPIYFYIPALKFRNPQASYNLASRLTFLQPEVAPGSFPDGSHPLTAGGSLPEIDARELGPVILGAMIPPNNRRARGWLQGCRVELQEPQILYFPFAQVDLFWKELWTGLTFQRNASSEDFSH